GLGGVGDVAGDVEIVRGWGASVGAGDLPFDLTGGNVGVDNIEHPVVQGACHGHDGLRRWWRGFTEALTDIHHEGLEATALEAGDLPFDMTDENVRIDNIEQPVVQGAFHGHDGLRRWWQDFTEALTDIHHEVLDATALDAERVLAEIRSQGHFRETGLPIDLR